MNDVWKLWIDTGGTFTDCIAINPHGNLKRLKVLSTGVLKGRIISATGSQLIVDINFPSTEKTFAGFKCRIYSPKLNEYTITRIDVVSNTLHLNKRVSGKVDGCIFELTTSEEVPVFAARLLTDTPLNHRFPKIELKLGSTRGTNALLERKGARTAYITTKGFKDLLLIGDQQRPELFTLNVKKPSPLYSFVFEVDERIDANGNVLRPLSESGIEGLIKKLVKHKIESIAIAFVNSYKNSVHENLLSQALSKQGFQYVSQSSDLSSSIRILPRAETAVANAYLHPVIHKYLSRIKEGTGLGNFKVMSSAGGLFESSTFQPKDSLLSGPAGGVIGAIMSGEFSGESKIISFDMGGTSTDVSLSNGRPEYRFESVVGHSRILSPSIAIETIAAGGGSICDFDGYRFTVGPQSAGADPGPACYGAGGPLTITDVNLLLGRLDESGFSIPVSKELSIQELNKLVKKVYKTSKKKYTHETILTALIQIANEKMAEAIHKVSVQRGFDATEYSLVSFGGAGGQHACHLAAILGIRKMIIPYDAGLLSAYGIGNAKTERIAEKLLLKSLGDFIDSYDQDFEELIEESKLVLINEGFREDEIRVSEHLVFARLKGQETSVEVITEDALDVRQRFVDAYRKIYGYWMEDREIEIESIRIRVEVQVPRKSLDQPRINRYEPVPIYVKRIWDNNKWYDAPVYRWEELNAGAEIHGPALVISENSTQYISGEWEGVLQSNSNLVCKRKSQAQNTSRIESEEAQLELFTNRFTSIAQNMGAMLQRTAFSVNVKERLDFSCALLDPDGYLIVNAPHIPVHLGSLGICVRTLKERIKMKEGDVIITNHPAFGGSHLPDITLVKPVFYRRKLAGYVVNRAHHAEIGGIQPGSTPAHAKYLEEEGVIISPTYLIRSGMHQWNEIKKLLLHAKYHTRNVQENLSDLRAALAALMLGDQELRSLCDRYGLKEVNKYMKDIGRHAAALMLEKIKSLAGKKFKAEEKLDDGSLLKVSIHFFSKKCVIDFSGSSPVHAMNLNATEAIVRSVVIYVLRLLLGKPVPLNEGLMKNVELILPTGLLNPSFNKPIDKLPAVVGGNTEVSQRLTDTLLKALRLAACSQGTMNNFLFGNSKFGYYETIGGGTGAGNGFDGFDAVHQHMTNTKITDAEVLEWRYPVRLNRFEIRRQSGGKGKFSGGDGIVREFCFQEPLDVNILSQHRVVSPYGMRGGERGKTGEQLLIRADGTYESIGGIDSVSVMKEDCLIIKTPGGGGWGKR